MIGIDEILKKRKYEEERTFNLQLEQVISS